jgi:hypothetical protein
MSCVWGTHSFRYSLDCVCAYPHAEKSLVKQFGQFCWALRSSGVSFAQRALPPSDLNRVEVFPNRQIFLTIFVTEGGG